MYFQFLLTVALILKIEIICMYVALLCNDAKVLSFRWFSKCVLQSRGQEIIDGLKVALQGMSCSVKTILINCLVAQ